jgi:hypothetical protein
LLLEAFFVLPIILKTIQTRFPKFKIEIGAVVHAQSSFKKWINALPWQKKYGLLTVFSDCFYVGGREMVRVGKSLEYRSAKMIYEAVELTNRTNWNHQSSLEPLDEIGNPSKDHTSLAEPLNGICISK